MFISSFLEVTAIAHEIFKYTKISQKILDER